MKISQSVNRKNKFIRNTNLEHVTNTSVAVPSTFFVTYNNNGPGTRRGKVYDFFRDRRKFMELG